MREKESVKNARIFNRKMPYAGSQLDLEQLNVIALDIRNMVELF